MVQVWFMDSEDSDQRLEHKRNPPIYLDLATLYKKTGVEYFRVSQSRNDLDKVALIFTFFSPLCRSMPTTMRTMSC